MEHSPRDLSPDAPRAPSELDTIAETSSDASSTILSEPGEVPRECAGETLGRYKLVERIGEGGCGVVYVAEQTEPVRRRVALKVIKLGMDTSQVVARFEAERQALAMMDHPNIAKVFDAGANSMGRPYFVMELVRGTRITDFCDRAMLSIATRLELFIQVCQAIQHAHQKGIIHRDIKPSNVLVAEHDGVAVPKVIDFGIAKATGDRLTDATLYTQVHQFIGTPAYMSPEQAEMGGLDIDTRSDIYSLGVLLYELLAGATPFEPNELTAQGFDAIRKTIREKEPLRPSTRVAMIAPQDLAAAAKRRACDASKLAHQLKGDLDWIVMKCLEKDRTRRYETANGLAADLKRYLSNEPVIARPPSTMYRFQKAWRRHKAVFSTAAIVFIALVSGLGISVWALYRAKTEASKSQQVSRFLKDMLEGAGPAVAVGRDTTLLREILDKTANRISADLKTQPGVECELRTTIGQTYEATGDYAQAETMQRKALALAQRLYGNGSPEVATVLTGLGSTLSQRGRLVEAAQALNQSLGIWQRLHRDDTSAASAAMHVLGIVYTKQSRYADAKFLIERAIAVRRRTVGLESFETLDSLENLAVLLYRQGRYAELGPLLTDLVATLRRVLKDQHPLTLASMSLLAVLRYEQADFVQAEALDREIIEVKRRVFGPEHPVTLASMDNLAVVLGFEGRDAEAEELSRRIVEIEKRKLGPENLDTLGSLNNLAEYLRNQGRYEEAEKIFRQVMEVHARTVPPDHPFRLDTLTSFGQLLRIQHRFTEAEQIFRQVLTSCRAKAVTEPNILADALSELALTLVANAKAAEALPLASECLAIREKNQPEDWRTFAARALLGECLIGQDQSAQAEPLLLTGCQGMEQRRLRIPAYQRFQMFEGFRSLVALYKTLNRSEQAAEWQKVLDRESGALGEQH